MGRQGGERSREKEAFHAQASDTWEQDETMTRGAMEQRLHPPSQSLEHRANEGR